MERVSSNVVTKSFFLKSSQVASHISQNMSTLIRLWQTYVKSNLFVDYLCCPGHLLESTTLVSSCQKFAVQAWVTLSYCLFNSFVYLSKDIHTCKKTCHEGACKECSLTSTIRCRCGHRMIDVSCRDLVEALDVATGEVSMACDRKCTKKKDCGKHKCNTKCCMVWLILGLKYAWPDA